MRAELREKILRFNRERAAHREAAEDLARLLAGIPPGILKQLLRDAGLAALLEKYGIGEAE